MLCQNSLGGNTIASTTLNSNVFYLCFFFQSNKSVVFTVYAIKGVGRLSKCMVEQKCWCPFTVHYVRIRLLKHMVKVRDARGLLSDNFSKVIGKFLFQCPWCIVFFSPLGI